VLVVLEQDEAQMRYGNRRIMDQANLDAMLPSNCETQMILLYVTEKAKRKKRKKSTKRV